MSSKSLVLGIDAGTGGLRACIFDLKGRLVAAADRTYATQFPRPGWATQRPADWCNALCGATREALSRSDVRAERVGGIAIDAPCDILLTDAAARPRPMPSCGWIFAGQTRRGA